jgi:hypothetical protein
MKGLKRGRMDDFKCQQLGCKMSTENHYWYNKVKYMGVFLEEVLVSVMRLEDSMVQACERIKGQKVGTWVWNEWA